MIRLLIRIGVALLGAAIGLIIGAVVLDDMTLDGAAFLLAIVIFVVLTAVLEPLIEKIGDEHVSLIATFSSLITTFLALLITELVSDGLNISGASTWVFATLIVWACTALATWILLRMFIKNVRENR
jgi:putative membrane protein